MHPNFTRPDDDRPVMLAVYGPDWSGTHPAVFRTASDVCPTCGTTVDGFGKTRGEWRPVEYAESPTSFCARFLIHGWRECTPEERADADKRRNKGAWRSEGDEMTALRQALDDYLGRAP